MNNKQRAAAVLGLVSSAFSGASILASNIGPNVGLLAVGGVILGAATVLFVLSLRENESPCEKGLNLED